MVNSSRVYGIVEVMLSKAELIGSTSDSKILKKERKDLLLLQKILSKELKL